MTSDNDKSHSLGSQDGGFKETDLESSAVQIKAPEKRKLNTTLLLDHEIETIQLRGQMEVVELRGQIVRGAEWIASLFLGIGTCIAVEVFITDTAMRVVSILGLIAIAGVAIAISRQQRKKMPRQQPQDEHIPQNKISTLGLSG